MLNPGNVLHGIILISTMPNPLKVEISDNNYNSLCYQWYVWIFGYSLWSTVIVYNLFCHYKLHLIVLYIGVPILMIIWTKSENCIQHFVYSMYLYQVINVSPFIKYHLPFYLMNDDQKCQHIMIHY